MKHALILCSGGIDSTTSAYLAYKKKYVSVTFLFYAYGQPQEAYERRAAKYHAHQLSARYVEIKLTALANLTRKKMMKQKKNETSLNNTKQESAQWFVPGRNTLFIAHALTYIESQYSQKEKIDLYLGFKNEGKDSFPDTTQEYVQKVQKVLKQASHHRILLKTPLSTKDKEDIIKKGMKLKVDYAKTWSCYQPTQDQQCGLCLACRLRKAGFKWAGVQDPTSYVQ